MGFVFGPMVEMDAQFSGKSCPDFCTGFGWFFGLSSGVNFLMAVSTEGNRLTTVVGMDGQTMLYSGFFFSVELPEAQDEVIEFGDVVDLEVLS